jgi:hypothetical protein
MSAKRTKAKTALRRVGIWATIWWGISGAYVVLLAWMSKGSYVDISTGFGSNDFFSDWQSAISDTYSNYSFLPGLLAFILIVWAAGGWIWLRELKRQKISYKAAFKDLFLTLR